MGIIKEFRDFAIRGNMVDMAVGIIIGAAFTSVVNSLVKDVLMPPLGAISGGLDFSDKKLIIKAGPPEVTLNYGLFLNALISFVIVAFAVFVLVKAVNKARSFAEREKAAAPPPPPPADVVLLTEIRDLLKTSR
ncbi:MAG: large-conductance mechanosensitive channel protein MscL [Phycisphaerales bacterium]|nr:large-conductance mechanosensitive channel protein MscL [Phycisphaerales bacterium]